MCSVSPVKLDSTSRTAAVLKPVQKGRAQTYKLVFTIFFHKRTWKTKRISLFSYFGNTTSMACEHCDPSCSQCWGRGNRNCLRCRDSYVYLKQWGQCLQRCPPNYYEDRRSKTCHKCHPTCKTCSGEENLFLCCLVFGCSFLFWGIFLFYNVMRGDPTYIDISL